MGRFFIVKKTKSYLFRVSSLKDFNVIINHFNQFSLITQKRADFKLLQQVYILMLRGEHFTDDGLRKIVAIRASMNQGIKSSQILIAAFPYVVPVARPKLKNQKLHDPNWLAGFTSVEGCFLVGVSQSRSNKLNEKVELIFQLAQHSRDQNFIKSLVNYFIWGRYKVRANCEAGDLKVTKFSDIVEKIIPFFKKHYFHGVNIKDFYDFCEVAELMKNKSHLTASGLEQIKKNKSGY